MNQKETLTPLHSFPFPVSDGRNRRLKSAQFTFSSMSSLFPCPPTSSADGTPAPSIPSDTAPLLLYTHVCHRTFFQKKVVLITVGQRDSRKNKSQIEIIKIKPFRKKKKKSFSSFPTIFLFFFFFFFSSLFSYSSSSWHPKFTPLSFLP